MSRTWSRLLRLSISLALLIGTVSFVRAAGWSDDFNDGSATDGNPVTWSPHLFFPGNYDASSGDYKLSAPGGGSDGQLAAWVDSVSFTDTYIRTQGVIEPNPSSQLGGNLVLLGRLNPDALLSYILYLDDGGTLGLQIILGGPETLADIVPSVNLGDINAASDVIMELNIVGDQLSGYAWRPDQPKPATPQITATNNVLTSGKAGIAYDEDDDATIGVYRFVSAQDTPFVDALAGDFNGDGGVDAADYVVWRKGALSGSFDQDDYNAWRQNFGAGGGSGLGAAAVPEPQLLVQLLAAIAGFTGLAGSRWRSILG